MTRTWTGLVWVRSSTSVSPVDGCNVAGQVPHVEGVGERRAGWSGGRVERREVVVVELDLGPLGDLVAQADEDLDDLASDAVDEVFVADRAARVPGASRRPPRRRRARPAPRPRARPAAPRARPRERRAPRSRSCRRRAAPRETGCQARAGPRSASPSCRGRPPVQRPARQAYSWTQSLRAPRRASARALGARPSLTP